MIQKNNGNQFASMIRQVFDNKKYAELTGLAIQVAYEVFWRSGEYYRFASMNETLLTQFRRRLVRQ